MIRLLSLHSGCAIQKEIKLGPFQNYLRTVEGSTGSELRTKKSDLFQTVLQLRFKTAPGSLQDHFRTVSVLIKAVSVLIKAVSRPLQNRFKTIIRPFQDGLIPFKDYFRSGPLQNPFMMFSEIF